MLRVDHQRWGQTQAGLRCLALHDMAQGACATQVVERAGCHLQTVMEWLHLYNETSTALMRWPISAPLAAPLCVGIATALGQQVRAAQQQAARP